MYQCFLCNEVPPNWTEVSYASLAKLAGWYQDLEERANFVRSWMLTGHPSAYWLSGFFFPHGFVTAILQAHARKHQKAIDYLKFKFNVLSVGMADEQNQVIGADPSELEKGPEDGIYVYGATLESARWDNAQHCLIEQCPGAI
jgi:dynein heavy chain, axonemal